MNTNVTTENQIKKRKKIDSSTVSSVIFKTICVIFMLAIALTYLFVVVWMVLNSFRDSTNYINHPFKIFDINFSKFFENYITVFKYRDENNFSYFGMLMNSFIHMSIGVIIGLIFEPLIGYIMAKFCFKKLNSFLFGLIIITMTIPNVGTVYHTVRLMNVDLGLKNNWLNLIIQLSGGINFSAIVYKNYFNNIPSDYAESAYLDGASELKTYFSIYFILCAPLLIATTVLRIIAFWNDYYSIYLYMPQRPTIALGIWNISSSSEFKRNYTAQYAILTLTSLISLTLYAAFSSSIMSSLSVGGVKA